MAEKKSGETTAEQFEQAAAEAQLSVDPRDSSYKLDDDPELAEQTPPHGPQVVQDRGTPEDHGTESGVLKHAENTGSK
jgi:hypothetical protein